MVLMSQENELSLAAKAKNQEKREVQKEFNPVTGDYQ